MSALEDYKNALARLRGLIQRWDAPNDVPGVNSAVDEMFDAAEHRVEALTDAERTTETGGQG